MRRKTGALAGTALLVAVLFAGGAVAVSDAGQASPTAQEHPANTAAVERGRLSAVVSLDGTLVFQARSDGSPYAVVNRARGTYTDLPDEGDKVACGDVIYRVDDHPVLLLCGAVPAYRDLHTGDAGQDVRQLNRNLRRLGYGADIDPDDHFTWNTREGLEMLQDHQGVAETGELAIDDAVFLPEPVRIAKVTATLGGSAGPGAQVARATSDTLEVKVDLDASQQGEVKRGNRARITLPGNRQVTGRVDRLGRVAEVPAGGGHTVGDATIPAYLSLDQPQQARRLDSAPAHVDIATKGVQNALSVPVVALVGRSGGGFAVEVVRNGARGELVAVTLGLFDTTAGRVQVDSGLREGDHVVVPSS